MTSDTTHSTFNVVLSGYLLEGFDRNKATKALAQMLNTSVAQAEKLLKGQSRVIKREVSREQATKYKLLLASHGILSVVKASRPSSARVTNISEARQKRGQNQFARATKQPATAQSNPAKASKPVARQNTNASKNSREAQKKTAPEKNVKRVAVEKGEASRKKVTRNKTQTPTKNIQEQIDSNIFQGILQPSRVNLFQQLQLVFSCSALVVLAVLFLGINLSLLYTSLERLVSFFFFNQSASLIGGVFSYLVPSIFCALLVLLLLRPIFARSREFNGVSLTAKNERNLNNFIKQIAVMVGSPRPQNVILTDEYEVDAEFKPGLNNIKEANIQMRIGLPLLMVADIPVLAGACAAALSRFDDKTGMYMQYVLRELNARFEDAWENRDSWQSQVDSWKGAENMILRKVVAPVTQIFLTPSAWLAYPFMMLVRILSAHTSRAQVLRADAYFNAMAGTRSFVDHFRKTALCSYAYIEAESSVREGIDAKKYVNDLPALLLHAYKNLPDSCARAVDDEIVEQTTHWIDLKPCNRDRMIHAEDHEKEGIVIAKAEAWRLLQDLKASSRAYTMAYYTQHDLGVDEKSLVDARELATSSNEARMRDEICAEYFNKWFEPDLFWQTNQLAYARSISKQQRIVEINECIKILRRTSPDYMALKTSVKDKAKKYAYSRLALDVHKSGYKLDDTIPGFENTLPGDVTELCEYLRREYEGQRAQQRDLCRVMGERLCFALAFLKDEREQKIAEVVMTLLTTLEAQSNRLEPLHAFISLVPNYRERMSRLREQELNRRLRRVTREVATAYEQCMSEFKRYRWPFNRETSRDNGKGPITLADYIAKSVPALIKEDASTASNAAALLDNRVDVFKALREAIFQCNRFLNGKIAPLAQKAEQENNIARIKMTVTGKQAG